MKELYDGTEVDINTPTKVKNGKRYLLTEQEINEYDARQVAWAAGKPERDAEAILDRRVDGYGSWQEQADMQYWDAVNGTTTWVDHITEVKTNNPK